MQKNKIKLKNSKYLENLANQILILDKDKINKMSQIFLEKFNQKKKYFYLRKWR